MKIGSAWTIYTEENGKSFISVALDGVITSICPFLKKLNITLGVVEEKSNSKAPDWTVNVSVKKEKETEAIPY